MESTKTDLCTKDAMDRCRNFEPFVREIRIEVASLDTQIIVEVDGCDRKRYSVGRCPYRVKDLIQDQGLDMMFGGRRKLDHEAMLPSCTRGSRDYMELEKLLEVLEA